MFDIVAKIRNSSIQHGPQNDRIYLMHLSKEDLPELVDLLHNLAIQNNYSKIFAKIPEPLSEGFLKQGYGVEARIPGLFHGRETGLLLGYYLNEERQGQIDHQLNKAVLEAAKEKHNRCENKGSEGLSDEFTFRLASPTDAPQMASLYAKVFPSYPFPITDPSYIESSMQSNVLYFGIWEGDTLVALSSCEMNIEDHCVEMTDFAVDPAYRGRGLSMYLLMQMERAMKDRQMKTAYTIARSASYGMNLTFAGSGYAFCGLLPQNTQIGGQIEDMNVWFKSLA
jgi:putative beta-lysine N-acetyltransferase